MITVTAPQKAAQQHCGWLGPRGLEGSIVQIPPVRLRHAKVVASRQYPRKKPVVACICPRIALFGVFFPEKIIWRNVCGWRALLVLWSLTPLLWSFAGQIQAVELVRN